MKRLFVCWTLTLGVARLALGEEPRPRFTPEDIAFLETFSIRRLPSVPIDRTNALADNPDAVALGKALFFDARFSLNGAVSCATCHQPERYFTDGRETARGVGQTDRNAPSILGTSYNTWFFWDGRVDSLWAQALGPLEDLREHGGTRTSYVKTLARHYRQPFEALFGALDDVTDDTRYPDRAGPYADDGGQQAWQAMAEADRARVTRAFVGMGKAIAAYERTLVPGRARFDDYVDAVVARDFEKQDRLFSSDEVAGLRLFLGRANCSQCHTGPLFTNQSFHSIGLPPADPARVELGRTLSVASVLASEFNCRTAYSDSASCAELDFIKRDGFELIGAFKTPSLRNVAETAPYMHRGQFETLRDVLDHYNLAPVPRYDETQHPQRPHTDIVPLKLTVEELTQIEAFLRTLTGPAPKRERERERR